jgi:hypothetical protein
MSTAYNGKNNVYIFFRDGLKIMLVNARGSVVYHTHKLSDKTNPFDEGGSTPSSRVQSQVQLRCKQATDNNALPRMGLGSDLFAQESFQWALLTN